MTNITNKGRELADRLGRHVGWAPTISETCSLICRHGTTYNRIQEAWCSVEMTDRETARLEAREARLEARIRDLAGRLPEHDSGPWRVRFEGDPRGWTVRLVAPNGAEVGVA